MYKNTLDLTDQEKPEPSANIAVSLPKHNRMWGTAYLLMDSNAFMKETGGNKYQKITDMFSNIWNAYKYRVLENIYL
jgi:hypothetical protein